MSDRSDELVAIINELTDRIKAEPNNPDLPPLLAEAQTELSALRTAEEAAEKAKEAATAAAAANPPAASTAAPAATASAPTAAPAAARPQVRPRPTPPTAAPAVQAAPARAHFTMVAGNVTAADHPSRLPPASRPTPAGPKS